MSALVDVNGNVIEVGDWLLWAAQVRYSSHLHFGRVTKITDNSVSVVLPALYDHRKSKTSMASLFNTQNNAMVIDKLTVPADKRALIEEAYDARRGKEVPQTSEDVRRPRRKSQSSKST